MRVDSELRRNALQQLQAASGPCVSIYIPCDEETSGVAQETRCDEAMATASGLLAESWGENLRRELTSLIESAFQEHAPTRRTRGLAIFATSGRESIVIELERHVPPLTVVATSFHLRPLLRIARGSAPKTRSSLAALSTGMRNGSGSDHVATIAARAVRGEVKCLVLEKDFHLWGRLDRISGQLSLHNTQRDGHDDDVLDDIAEVVIAAGGEVVTVAAGDMPTASPIAALFARTA